MAIFLPLLIGFLGTSPGSLEIFVLFVAVVLLFGARSLPGFARQFGRIMEELRKASWDFKRQMMDADYEIRQASAEVGKDLKDLTNLEASGEGHGSDPADETDHDADYTDDQGDEYHDYHADDPEAEDTDTPAESASQDPVSSPEDDVLPQADKPEPGGESIVARGALAAEALPGPAVADEPELPDHPNVADQASEKDPPTHG